MLIEGLELEDFRNYAHERVEFTPGINVVIGRNAQGKTNLLEAINCLSGLGSPRATDAALVRDGTERALLHADLRRGPRRFRIDLEIRKGQGARALLNGTAVGGLRALRESVTTVFFGPDDLALVKGRPDGRRRFVDELIVKLRPARDGVRREWERVLKQRNALLRTAPRDRSTRAAIDETLGIWDDAFCRAGAELVNERLSALAHLEPLANKRYEAIAGGGRLEIVYESDWVSADLIGSRPEEGGDRAGLEAALRSAVEELRVRELERGMSLVGPQRDDLRISVAAAYPGEGDVLRDARQFASQGDQRTAALALKLAEFDLLAQLAEQPILLLDDIFSELDQHRRAYLAETIGGNEQVLVTAAEPLGAEIIKSASVLEIRAGKVHRT